MEKLKSLGSLAKSPTLTNKKKISHVNLFPEDYQNIASLESVSSFHELMRSVTKRYEQNSEIISKADREIQDLLHEIELLPSVNAADGYCFYKKIRIARQKRRIAKMENTKLQPLYEYINTHPGFLKEMESLRTSCMSADVRITNYEYVYRIQE